MNIGRESNRVVIVLTEGDVVVDGDEYKHVSSGEVRILADGTIDEQNGELVEIDPEAIAYAVAAGKEIFNMENVG